MLEISQKINNKVFSTEVKSIEDIEYIYQKLRTIQNMLQSSRNSANRLRYFMERLSYLTTDRCVSRILEIDQDEIPSIIEGLESIGRFVERA
jgi:precorrin isomerase